MAHELNIINGEASMAYAGSEKPWHGLGLSVPGLMTTKEALVAGRLDYHVDIREMYTKKDISVGINGEFVEVPEILIPNTYATVRRDTNVVLGVVGGGYTVVQNIEAFEFFDHALGNGAACLETVGALGKGERIWAMAKCPEIFEPVAGDPIEKYLLLTTTHDGSGSIKCLFSNIRTVCANTLSLALKGSKNTISVKHTKNVKGGLAQAKELLTASSNYWEKSKEAYKSLASKQMDSGEVKKFLRNLFPGKKLLSETDEAAEEVAKRTQNIRDRVETLFNGQATGANLAGTTRYGMLNAVTHYLGKEAVVRTRKDGSKPEGWINETFGLGVATREKAGELLLQD